jgi:hypothetical protein
MMAADRAGEGIHRAAITVCVRWWLVRYPRLGSALSRMTNKVHSPQSERVPSTFATVSHMSMAKR